MRDRLSVLQEEKVLEVGCTTVEIHLTLLDYTEKNGRDGNLMVYGGFYLNKKKKRC